MHESNKLKEMTKSIKASELSYDPGDTEGDHFYVLPYRTRPIDPHQFLVSLSSKSGKFSWEYYKKKRGDQFIRFWSQTGLQSVIDPILTNFEDAEVVECENRLVSMDDNVIAGGFHLVKPDYYPLRIRDTSNPAEDRDRLAEAILAALRDAKGEYMVQILFSPSREFGFDRYVLQENFWGGPRKKIKKLREREESPNSQELATDIEEKLNNPSCFKVQVRVVGSQASKPELIQGFQSISSALRQFGHRTERGNRAELRPIPVDEVEDFLLAMANRNFYDASKFHQKIFSPFIARDPYPHYLSSKELRWFFELPIEKYQKYQLHTAKMGSHLRPPEQVQQIRENGVSKDASLIGHDQRGDPVFVTEYNLHTYICGKTGTGKSTLMQHMVLDKINNGENVIVLDPHGDLVHDVLQRMDPEKMEDVIYISPLSPIGFNALSIPKFPEGDKDKLDKLGRRKLKEAELGADEKQSRALANMIKDHFGREFWGPRLSSIFNWFAKGLLNEKGANFVDFYHILNDEETARKFAKDTAIQELEHYIHTFFEQLDDRDKHSTLNKIGKIRRSRVLRQMLCIREPDIEIADMIEPGKIVMINLSKGLHDKDKAHFVGSALSNLIWSCIGHRQILQEEDRGETYLFADEFQSFATEIFQDMLSEGRKFGLRLILANQYTSQLDEGVWEAIEGNVGTYISFATSQKDAQILSDNYGDKVDTHEFVNLVKYNALVRLPGGGVTRIQTRPPADIKNPDALNEAIKEMEKLSPNVEMKMQRANTARWENEEADKWDILTGIYRRQIEAGGPPLIADVKEEEPRNNLFNRLKSMGADGDVVFNPTKGVGRGKTVALNAQSIEELKRLVGTSNQAGGDEHKELIFKLWETLEHNGFTAHVIRQNQEGVLPDLSIENSQRDDLEWGGVDVEVEKSTKTKPTKVLTNLAKAENRDRKVLFFSDDIDGARKIYNIIMPPFASGDDTFYKRESGKIFDPHEEFTYPYWEPDSPEWDWNDICEILVLEDGMIKRYHPETDELVPIVTHERVAQGGEYIFDEAKEYVQQSLDEAGKDEENTTVKVHPDDIISCPECDEKVTILDGECLGCGKEFPPTNVLIRDDEGYISPWITEYEDEYQLYHYLSNYLRHKVAGETEEIEKMKEKRPHLADIAEMEYKCSQEGKTVQPDDMELRLDVLPDAWYHHALLVEAFYAHAKYSENGFKPPMSPVTLKELFDCLEDKGNGRLPERDESFGVKFSNFLDKFSVEKKDKKSREGRTIYHLHKMVDLLSDLYVYRLINQESIEQGIYTYPLFYELTDHQIGRTTMYRNFEHDTKTKHDLDLEIFHVESKDRFAIFDEILKMNDDELSVENLADETGLSEKEVEEGLDDWNTDDLKLLKSRVDQLVNW